MARMRTIKQAVQQIKQDDPESCISEWWIRQLVKSDKLKCHKAGNRHILDMEALEKFLKNPPTIEEVKQLSGVLRKIT